MVQRKPTDTNDTIRFTELWTDCYYYYCFNLGVIHNIKKILQAGKWNTTFNTH